MIISSQAIYHTFKNRAKTLLFNESYQYDEKGFTLASGLHSHHYMDCKQVTLSARGAALIGPLFLYHVHSQATAVGGLTTGADPLAYATVAASNNSSSFQNPLNAFIIRKTSKNHGTKKFIEGPVLAGTPVMILEDVVTTGGSTITAIDRAKEAGLDIKGVIILVDREESQGMETVRNQFTVETPVTALFTMSEIIEQKPI